MTKNCISKPRWHSYSYSYRNSPSIQCSTSTANSLEFTEIYGCTINLKSNVTFTGLHFHRKSFRLSLPGYLKEQHLTSGVSQTQWVLPVTGWVDFRVECVLCCACGGRGSLGPISCSGWVRLRTCTSVYTLQPGEDPLPRYPNGL